MAERLLAPRRPCAQHVQAHARDDRRQPALEVLDVARVAARVGAAEAEPRVLHRVVGLAVGAEHPVGDGPQHRASGFEATRQEILPGVTVRHVHTCRVLGFTLAFRRGWWSAAPVTSAGRAPSTG